MIPRLVVAATDTNVGKTVFSAALTAALDGCYWKPVQAGLGGETDSERVRLLARLPPERILPERYRLTAACSPHHAAEIDGVEIDPARLAPPASDRPLVIEASGGLMVPLTRNALQIDVLARWQIPIVLAARTALGTINHSLLSLEALRRRNIPVLGIAFIGDESLDTERTIARIGGARRLGRLPVLATLDAETLAGAFKAAFTVDDFLAGGARP